jgi:hypothetical protein
MAHRSKIEISAIYSQVSFRVVPSIILQIISPLTLLTLM